MPNKFNEEILREEWKKEVERVNDIGLAMFADSVCNFWLKNITRVREDERKLLAEKVENMSYAGVLESIELVKITLLQKLSEQKKEYEEIIEDMRLEAKNEEYDK